MKIRYLISFILISSILYSCSNSLPGNIPTYSPTKIEISINSTTTATPFTPESEKIISLQPVQLFIPDFIQAEIGLKMPPNVEIVNSLGNSDCQITTDHPEKVLGEKIFSLVGTFASIEDDYEKDSIQKMVNGDIPENMFGKKIIFSSNTTEYLKHLFSIPSQAIILKNNEEISEFLFQNPDYLSFVPFEKLSPALKVFSIDGNSPYDQDFNASTYYLTIPIGVTCEDKTNLEIFIKNPVEKFTNRDPNKFTSVLLTGTTALVRATGAKMEKYGNSYPGEFIKEWFDEADISHISNESSFWEDCPFADPGQKDTFFCSRPEYVDLLTYLGVEVVELTGNHLVDKGVEPLLETIQILTDKGISFYAAGKTQTDAEKPALFEHNGNKIAFIGCNEAGPTFVWLQEYRPGVLRCDFDRMSQLVRELVSEGYLPIVTYQYWESFQFDAMPYQKKHSYQLVDSGAVIVSGSQSHLPMSMEVYRGGFIHYGLGNLFFDQMDIPVIGTRREFLDRHIFYDGRYLGTQLLTAMLEDYSQPHPMTQSDRLDLLQDAFEFFNYTP